MRKVVLFPVPLLLAFMAMGCQPPAQEMAPLRTAEQIQADVEAMRGAWIDMANAGNAVGLAALYADDAVFADPYGNVHQGRAAIEAYFLESLTRSSGYQIRIDGTVIQGDMLAGHGTWSATLEGSEGTMSTGGMWQNVHVYDPDGSLKIRLALSMIPTPMPEM